MNILVLIKLSNLDLAPLKILTWTNLYWNRCKVMIFQLQPSFLQLVVGFLLWGRTLSSPSMSNLSSVWTHWFLLFSGVYHSLLSLIILMLSLLQIGQWELLHTGSYIIFYCSHYNCCYNFEYFLTFSTLRCSRLLMLPCFSPSDISTRRPGSFY